MKRIKLLFIAGAAFALAVAAFVLGAADAPDRPAPVAQSGRLVAVAPVRLADVQAPARFSGVARGAKTAVASFTISGRLERRPYEIGDRLVKGTVIAELDADEHRNALAAAKASLAEVEAKLAQSERDERRARKLYEEDAATLEEVEKTVSGRETLAAKKRALRSRIDELRRILEEATLLAPISGVVTETYREPGEYASPGQPIYALSGQSTVEVEIEVPESLVVAIRPGQKIPVSYPLLGQRRGTGVVTSVSAGASGPGRLFSVTVALEPFPGLMPGIAVEAVFQRQARAGWTVPVDAVIDPSGRGAYVFAIREGLARRVPIEVRQLLDTRVVVGGALRPGEPVVVAGQFALLSGDPVEVDGQAAEATP